jgi:hypothetical protein
MAGSPIVSMLSQRPAPELEGMRDKMQTDISRLQADIDRLHVEMGQIEDALALQARRDARKSRGTLHRDSAGARILAVLSEHAEPLAPAAIIAQLEQADDAPTRGTVHTTLGRLVTKGDVEKVGQGLYAIADRENSISEPTENGTGEPPFTATRSQDGTQEVLGS